MLWVPPSSELAGYSKETALSRLVYHSQLPQRLPESIADVLLELDDASLSERIASAIIRDRSGSVSSLQPG